MGDTYLVRFYKYSETQYRVARFSGNEIIDVLNDGKHATVERETYSSDEERISEKERIEKEKTEREAEKFPLSQESIGEGETASLQTTETEGVVTKRKKRIEDGPPEPPKKSLVEARRKWWEKSVAKSLGTDSMIQGNDESITESCVEGEKETDNMDLDSHCEEVDDGEVEEGQLAFDTGMERYGYVDSSDLVVPGATRIREDDCDSEGEHLEEEDFVDGIINMSQEIRELRNAHGRQSYYEMKPIHVGTVTGVEIKFMGKYKDVTQDPIITV